MRKNSYKCLSIAGFDPSAGAGVLADVKTFENLNTYGFGVISAITFQNDIEFNNLKWVERGDIIKQIEILSKRFEIAVVKIGLIESLEVLEEIISFLKAKNSFVQIVWDPIIRASAGFEFHKEFDFNRLSQIFKDLLLITPNREEIGYLSYENDPEKAAKILSENCSVLLKGGHTYGVFSHDLLFYKGEKVVFEGLKIENSKHGTGCVLSAAIVANLVKGNSLETACREAKNYITGFIRSNNTLLGDHLKQFV